MKKQLALIGLLILAMFYPFASFQSVSASTYPKIISVDRAPISPTANLAVNTTFQIIDKYGLTNCSLFYDINGASNFNQVNAIIIDGDYQNGTFIAQIPKQPNNTTVQYYVKAQDMIGYISQSLNYSYVVSIDTTPPNITDVQQINPIGNPVLPTENITISAIISDDGSGVKNATLFYGTGVDQLDMVYNETQMVENDTGTYVATIPPCSILPNSNVTYVYYFVGACDNSNNSIEETDRHHCFVSEATSSYMEIDINVKNIYSNNLTATVEIFVSGMLPSMDQQPLMIEVDYPPYPMMQINATTNSDRFFYQGIIDYDFYLSGNSNQYPFDAYTLNLTFNIHCSQPNSLSTSTGFGNILINNIWTGTYIHYNTTDAYGYPVLVNTLTIQRNTYGDVFPLVLLIIMIFFLLGGTLLIDTAKLSERLTIILAVFIFIAGFYFSQGSTIPVPRIGFTIAERLLLSLVSGSAIFAVSSIIGNSMENHLEKLKSSKRVGVFLIKNLSLILDASAVIIFGYLWLLPILKSLPVLEYFLIIFGTLYGLVFRVVLCNIQFFTAVLKAFIIRIKFVLGLIKMQFKKSGIATAKVLIKSRTIPK